MTDAELERALAAIDAINREDPNHIRVRGRSGPKELLHGELVSEWIDALAPHAGAELRIAGRAHHLRRWEIPRAEYPKTRAGYLAWRRRLQEVHAEAASGVLRELDIPLPVQERVAALICKRGLGRDAEVQVLEDAICLVFAELQLAEFVAGNPPEKALSVLDRTLAKMSAAGRAAARTLPLDPATREILLAALDRA